MSSHLKGYFSEESIFALTSPSGGVICTVRLSGNQLNSCLKSLVGEPKAQQILQHPNQLTRVDLFSAITKKKIDDAMIVYFKNPKSFTGEDVLEFNLHGSEVIIQSLLESLQFLNCRQALPGEFSFRAVRNGKLSITQAEAISELITSKNTEAMTIALEKLEGTQHQFLLEISNELKNLAAFGELSIDFSDQNIDELSLDSLKVNLRKLISKLEKLEGSFNRGKLINDGLRVSILGLPNSGKSSFFNQILGEDRSIVSHIAGTTRDVIRESITLKNKAHQSISLRFEDTAGIHESDDFVEKIGIKRSLQSAHQSEIILLLCDANLNDSNSLEKWTQFCELLKEEFNRVLPTHLFLIFTKKDIFQSFVNIDYLNSFKEKLENPFIKSYLVSSETREGIEEVLEDVIHTSLKLMERDQKEIILTRLDHVQAVQQSIIHLKRGLTVMAEDLFAADIRQALISLSPVIGDFLPDDILSKIFSEFCIGK